MVDREAWGRSQTSLAPACVHGVLRNQVAGIISHVGRAGCLRRSLAAALVGLERREVWALLGPSGHSSQGD